MTDREALSAILRKTEINKINGHSVLAEICFTQNVFERMADHLIANGVVVQRWIPASEPPTVTGEYIAMIRGDVHPTSLYYSFEDEKWFLFGAEDNYDVTHWMPLPEPPKEGE